MRGRSCSEFGRSCSTFGASCSGFGRSCSRFGESCSTFRSVVFGLRRVVFGARSGVLGARRVVFGVRRVVFGVRRVVFGARSVETGAWRVGRPGVLAALPPERVDTLPGQCSRRGARCRGWRCASSSMPSRRVARSCPWRWIPTKGRWIWQGAINGRATRRRSARRLKTPTRRCCTPKTCRTAWCWAVSGCATRLRGEGGDGGAWPAHHRQALFHG